MQRQDHALAQTDKRGERRSDIVEHRGEDANVVSSRYAKAFGAQCSETEEAGVLEFAISPVFTARLLRLETGLGRALLYRVARLHDTTRLEFLLHHRDRK